MKRTTISLPDELAAALEREARRRRVSVSQIAREAIEAELGLAGDQPNAWPFIGLWESDGSLAAADVDDWLAEHWADDIEADAFAGSR
jgi:Arc/MetJ-type ribon-helix-helix transcriptional regulator